MAKLVQPPQKFIPPEWNQSNICKYNCAENARIASERLIDESDRLIEETFQTTKRTQQNINNKLDQRLRDLNKWKDELNIKLDELKKENEDLLNYKKRLESAIESCNEPLAISQDCLHFRENRIGIDVVHDGPEIELLKEVEVINGVQNLLIRTHEEAVEQIRLNRSAIYYLGKDLKDKFEAIKIDGYCEQLNNNSVDISLQPNYVQIEPNSVSPRDWREFSNSNIEKSERERINSTNLRGIIDSCLKTTCDDLKFQQKAVNISFEDRITECKRAKEKLEDHLAKILKEIGEEEKEICELKKAINDKTAPMMVSQTRLKERSYRPNVELCRDQVQYQLLDEVNEINSNVNRLKKVLYDSEQQLKALTRNQLSLEEDIQVKANSIYIDDVQCGQIRKSISHNYY